MTPASTSLIALALSGLLLTACSGQDPSTPADSAAPPAAAASAEQSPSYLFTVNGPSGRIDGIGEDTGEESLTVTLDVSDHATQFADRPIRAAYVLSTADLADRWSRWFADAAPNAVLSFTEPGEPTPRSIVLELADPAYDSAAGTLTFTARHLHREADLSPDAVEQVDLPRRTAPASFDGWSLFIDSTGTGDTDDDPPRTIGDCVIEPAFDCHDANLSGADLSGQNLAEGDLSGANLSGANLSGANLTSTDMGGANLRGANLRNAILVETMLRSADLTGADITGATIDTFYLNDATWVDGTRCEDPYCGGRGRS